MLTIYTDGACLNNGKKGAIATWAFYCLDTDEVKSDIVEGKHTCNTGELTAILEAIKYAIDRDDSVAIYSDSLYAINSSHKWNPDRKKKVKNYELIKDIWELRECINTDFIWVRGHNGNYYNELVDSVANNLAMATFKKINAE